MLRRPYPERHKTRIPYCSKIVEFSFYNLIESDDLFYINSSIVFLEINKRVIKTQFFLKIMVTMATIHQIVT